MTEKKACDRSVRKLYDTFYSCEIPVIPKPTLLVVAVLTTQGMLILLRIN